MTTTKQTDATPAKSYNGFAIQLENGTDLGLAVLIVEDEEGQDELVGNATTINEAKELAADDLRRTHDRLGRDEDPVLCPYIYKLWARGMDGAFRVACEIEA